MEGKDEIVKIGYLIEKTALSRSSAYKLVSKKKLTSLRIGNSLRFKKSDIDKYLEKCIVPENENKPVPENVTSEFDTSYDGLILI